MTNPDLIIRFCGDPCLRKKSVPVQEVGPGERLIIQSMISTMHHAKGIGLAAPQVGINQRFLVVDIGDGPLALINPRIIKKSGTAVLEEGCLSVPEVTVLIKRAKKITVQYIDENSHKKELTCEDLLARVIQHEIDHLNGKLIVDYASREEKKKYKEQLKLLESRQKEMA